MCLYRWILFSRLNHNGNNHQYNNNATIQSSQSGKASFCVGGIANGAVREGALKKQNIFIDSRLKVNNDEVVTFFAFCYLFNQGCLYYINNDVD